MLKMYCKIFGILLLGIFSGTLLLCLAFLIPLDPIQQHVKESINTIIKEGENPYLLDGYKGSSLDNYTDSIMLANASYKSEHVFYNAAMLAERTDNGKEQPIESLWDYIMKTEEQEVSAYGRYWHGYLILLKPLLVFLNYDQIRVLNGIIFFGILSGVVWGFIRRKMWRGLVAFIFAICSLFPMTIPFSLQFSAIFYIGTIACLFVIWKYEYLEQKQSFIWFFLVVGMLTSFFDFLTYPLFTLGMPLVLLCVLEKKSSKQKLYNIMENNIFWGIGYAGMWCGKWVMGSILTGKNLFGDASFSIALRLSSKVDDKKINMVLAVLRNGYIYFNFLGIVFLILVCVWVFLGCRKYKRYISENIQQLIWLFLIAIMPIVWYCIIVNHSYIHYWYTFRELAVSVFALGMMPEVLYRMKENQ